MRINLHIEKLILNGIDLDTRQASEVEQAVISGLKHQLMLNGVTESTLQLNNHRRVKGDAIKFKSGVASQQLGSRISRAVYRGISK